ncbi:LPS export ABC transporter permease LptG [Salinisphaera hydrothermalis]|uniref:Permease YjgP/YjgQ n=1 Tax=Salinisphaera hydrothermalis (strain C41B8) TaxID=1304275 RepID=A0A084ILT5_SALHC|nr:LPS export ABC transporter permease LptG [Salinisphaera hydrothermalis]KEZ77669.1 permease YjgP/YjgQ [Salinisphaera hydrothermalis C41B8]
MNLLIIDRYITRTILAATGMVIAVIAALLSLMLFISEVDNIGQGSFGLVKILIYCVLMLPDRIYFVLPVVSLLGALLALGALAAGSELVVIRSAGMSMKRLAVSVGIAGFVLAVLTVVLGELAAPIGVQNATMLRDKARHGEARQSVDNGLWLRNSGYVLRIDSVLPGGRIDGLDVYRLNDDGQLQLAVAAKRAHVDGEKLVIDHPRITHLSLTQSKTDTPATMSLPIAIKPSVLELAVTQPDELSSYGLWQYINYLDANDIDADDYKLALWRNIVTPFTVWVLVIFALPFAFGSLRSASAGQRLFVGGLIGLLFFLVNEIVASTGPVYGIPPWIAASLPTVLLAGGTGYWMHRLN